MSTRANIAQSEEILAALNIAAAAYQALADAGPEGLPEGYLYAVMMSKLSLAQFQGMVGLLIRQGMVRRESSRLYAEAL